MTWRISFSYGKRKGADNNIDDAHTDKGVGEGRTRQETTMSAARRTVFFGQPVMKSTGPKGALFLNVFLRHLWSLLPSSLQQKK